MRKRIFILVLASIFLQFYSRSGFTAVTSLKGDNDVFWSNRAIIVARITDFRPNLEDKLKLEIRAVAVTDSLIPTTLSVVYYPGIALKAEGFGKDVLIFAVVVNGSSGWCIEDDYIEFMPGGSAALVVKGVDDPAIAPVLEKVKKLREKPKGVTPHLSEK